MSLYKEKHVFFKCLRSQCTFQFKSSPYCPKNTQVWLAWNLTSCLALSPQSVDAPDKLNPQVPICSKYCFKKVWKHYHHLMLHKVTVQ